MGAESLTGITHTLSSSCSEEYTMPLIVFLQRGCVNVPVVRQQQAFESFGRWLARGCHRDRPLGKEGGCDIWMIRMKRFRAAQQQSSNAQTLSSVIRAGNVGGERTLIGHAARRGPCASLSQSNNSFRQDALQMSP